MVKNPLDTQNPSSYTFAVKKLCLVSLCTLSLLFVSCLSWIMEKPSFVLREIILEPRSFREMHLLLGIEVHNPNRFDLTLNSFEYTVYLNNEEIGNGRLEKELLISSSSVTQVQAPVVAKFKGLGKSLKAIITGDDLPYKIKGKVGIKTAFGSLNFPLSKEGRIDLKN
jgi:LEA14-like dessication related protein